MKIVKVIIVAICFLVIMHAYGTVMHSKGLEEGFNIHHDIVVAMREANNCSTEEP